MSHVYTNTTNQPLSIGSTSSPFTVGTGISISSGMDWLNSTTAGVNASLTGNTLTVKGDANIDGELTIKGKNLSEVLENIESRLAILHPNKELEEKWENLRGLRQAYVELEREIIEKEKMWAILKR